MNRDEWIQKLRRMGLSGYEAQVYLALLGETRAPASRVVRKSGVPQSKVYGALSSLVECGFAEQVLGNVKLYRGIPPAQAFENYRRGMEESLADSRQDMIELARQAPDTPTDDPGGLGIRLVRSGQILAVVEEAFDTVERDLAVAIPAPIVMGADTAKDREMIDRGVNLRYVIQSSLLNDPEHGTALAANAGETGVVRFTAEVPLRFMVMDGRTVMFELAEADGSRMGLVVPNEGLARNILTLFDQLWNGARALSELPNSGSHKSMRG